jgi:apolipoprotein N-acyltransferase
LKHPRSDKRHEADLSHIPLRFWPSTLLALGSGILYFLAFPGVDIWPLGFVAFVPLMVALRGQSPRRGLWLGWVSGFAMTMTGFYWLLEMLRVFSGFPTVLCALFMAVLCAFQAGRMALAGWLSARAERHNWPFGLSFAGAFATSEFIFPLLFPWYFGATVHSRPVLLQLAELGGPIAVGLVLVAFNLALSELIIARLERRATHWRRVLPLAAVPGFAAIYGAIRIVSVRASVHEAPRARVGIVQANMSLYGKRHEIEEGLRRHLTLTQRLREQDHVDFVVWSETSVMRPVDENSVRAALPRAFSRNLGVPALVGSVLVRPVDDAREYVFFNSALSTDQSGEVTGRYDKTYLLAFGEYLPLGEAFPILYEWSPNSGHFSQGTSLESLQMGSHHVSTNICYEDLIPGFVNKMFRHHDAELIVNMTNDAWFGNTLEPWQHLALAKFRAIEQRRFLIRSTNSGISAFVDPTGKVLAHTGAFESAAMSQSISWMTGKTFYRIVGDIPWWLVTIASFVAAFVRRRARTGAATTQISG